MGDGEHPASGVEGGAAKIARKHAAVVVRGASAHHSRVLGGGMDSWLPGKRVLDPGSVHTTQIRPPSPCP